MACYRVLTALWDEKGPVSWLECIANLNSELELACRTVKHSSLPRWLWIHRSPGPALQTWSMQEAAGPFGLAVPTRYGS